MDNSTGFELRNCVNLGLLFNLPMPQMPHLQNGDNAGAILIIILLLLLPIPRFPEKFTALMEDFILGELYAV